MRKIKAQTSEWIASKPKKSVTFTGKKYRTRKPSRGQGRS